MRGFSMFLRHTFGPAADIIAGGVLMVCGLGLIAWVLIEDIAIQKRLIITHTICKKSKCLE